MDKTIKKTALVVGASLLVLFLTGIFLPMLISTDTLPLSIIIILLAGILSCGFITLYFICKLLFVETKLNEIDKEKEDYNDHIC